MARSNASIAQALRHYAATLAAQDGGRFRIKAYRRAAETIDAFEGDLAQRIAQGFDPRELPGIGEGIRGVIQEIVATGGFSGLKKAQEQLPPEVRELSTRPGLDVRKVLRIYNRLGLSNLDELRAALESGRIRAAFDARTEFHVRQGLSDSRRLLLWEADKLTVPIERFLNRLPRVQVFQAGSLRRRQETVGNLNYVVTGSRAATVLRTFEDFGGITMLKRISPRRAVYQLASGTGVTLNWTPGNLLGTALVTATGSEAHVKRLLQRSRRSQRAPGANGLPDSKTEEQLYDHLGLPLIPPELREDRGEIEAAAAGRLPRLIEVGDIRGDLHMHTLASDGANSIEEMAEAARARNYEYIAITDHSQSLRITNGLTEARLQEQIAAIDALNDRGTHIPILKSAEVDILEDGRLDYSNRMLKQLDFSICSIHSRFGLNRQQQTDRILRAMDNPYFTILGHATGRLLLKREGYEINVESVLERAQANGCFFEINSSPDRLDLSDEHARLAKEAGVQVAINTDAHSTRELAFMSAGINQARRAWLEPTDVLNARPLELLRKTLRR